MTIHVGVLLVFALVAYFQFGLGLAIILRLEERRTSLKEFLSMWLFWPKYLF